MSWSKNALVMRPGETVWSCHDRSGRGAEVIADRGEEIIYACPTCHESWVAPVNAVHK